MKEAISNRAAVGRPCIKQSKIQVAKIQPKAAGGNIKKDASTPITVNKKTKIPTVLSNRTPKNDVIAFTSFSNQFVYKYIIRFY